MAKPAFSKHYVLLPLFALFAFLEWRWSRQHSCNTHFALSRSSETFINTAAGAKGSAPYAQINSLDAELRSHFTFYPGFRGGTQSDLLGSVVVGVELATALVLCKANPSCTFVAHSSETSRAFLCKGRPGNTPAGLIQVNKTEMNYGWVSADKRCCETYSSQVAAKDKGDLPSCVAHLRDMESKQEQNALVPQFTTYVNRRIYCYIQLEPSFSANSLEESMALCLDNEACTVFSYNNATGLTMLCHGFYDVPSHKLVETRGWLTVSRRGCELYDSETAKEELHSLSRPRCYSPSYQA